MVRPGSEECHITPIRPPAELTLDGLEANRIDVHSVPARKPLFMDESAHGWRLVRLGRGLGWSGVALKTCKTQTGALLTLSWAKAHGMMLVEIGS